MSFCSKLINLPGLNWFDGLILGSSLKLLTFKMVRNDPILILLLFTMIPINTRHTYTIVYIIALSPYLNHFFLYSFDNNSRDVFSSSFFVDEKANGCWENLVSPMITIAIRSQRHWHINKRKERTYLISFLELHTEKKKEGYQWNIKNKLCEGYQSSLSSYWYRNLIKLTLTNLTERMIATIVR